MKAGGSYISGYGVSLVIFGKWDVIDVPMSHLSGAVCPSGTVPLSRLAVVSEGQEGKGGRLLVRQGHRASIQQAG